MPSALKPEISKISSSGDASAQISPGMSPNLEDSFPSHHNRDLTGFSNTSANRLFPQSSTCLPSFMSSANHTQSPTLTTHPSLLPSLQERPTSFLGHRETTDVEIPRASASSSNHPIPDFNSKIKEMASSQSELKKTATKPMWVDVSVLPRIPKIKRESTGSINNNTSQRSGNIINGSRGNRSNSATSSNGYGMPERGINSLAQDKSRQHSVDHQKGTAGGQSQRHRPDGAGSSSSFSSSFSSSSSTGYSASQPCYSSSSSAVSFRINPSGNSWHSRRLSIPSSSSSGCSMQEHWRKKEEEQRKRQLHKDKQMLLASRTMVNKEQESNNIYDPFNPTLSDSSSSDGETESSSLDRSSQRVTDKKKTSSLGNKDGPVQSKLELIQVKTETQEMEISQEEPKRDSTQETISQDVRCKEEYVKTYKESRLVDANVVKQTELCKIKIKKEPELEDVGECGRSGNTVPHSPDLLKTEKDALEEANGQNVGTSNIGSTSYKKGSSSPSSAPTNKKLKPETKSNTAMCSKSPSGGLGIKKKTSKSSKEQQPSSTEARQKEKERDKEQSFRQSNSKDRARSHSNSESSQSSSPERTRRKRQRSQSRSKDRRRSR